MLRAQDSGVPCLLLDRTLAAKAVWVTAFTSDSLSYTTSTGLMRTEALSEFAALVPATPAAWRPPVPRLHLADGQCFPGQPRPSPEGADSVRWNSSLFGILNVPLDATRQIVLLPDPPPRPAATGDSVVLANGDALSGFLEDFGESVRFDAGGSTLEIDPANVRAVYIDNPPVRRAGMMAWLADGTVAAASSLQSRRDGSVTVELGALGAAGEATLHPVGPRTADVPLSGVHAVVFDGETVAPLASVPVASQSAEGERRWLLPVGVGDAHAALLHAATIELPGPMSATWTLPARATRFGALAALPESCRVWGHCELIVSAAASGGEPVELLRRRFDAASPTAELSVALPDSEQPIRLTLTLTPGEYGPAHDRLVLERALVLLAPSRP